MKWPNINYKTSKNEISNLINLIDDNLKHWILRFIVLNKVILKLPDGSDLNYIAIKKYVEYETNTSQLVPVTPRVNYSIIASLFFKYDNEIIKNLKDKDWINESVKTIYVKTITTDVDLKQILLKVRKNFDLDSETAVEELHIYYIINEGLYNDAYILEDRIVALSSKNKKIYIHTMSSNFFFNLGYGGKFLNTFYYKEPKKWDLDYNENIYNRESEKLMNIFIFRGFEWGIIRLYFKYLNFDLNSGMSSSRHKFNLVEYRLSKFINWSGIEKSLVFRDSYYDRYIDGNIIIDEIMGNYRSKVVGLDSVYPSNFKRLFVYDVIKNRYEIISDIVLININIINIKSIILNLNFFKTSIFKNKDKKEDLKLILKNFKEELSNKKEFKNLEFLNDLNIIIYLILNNVNNTIDIDINKYSNLNRLKSVINNELEHWNKVLTFQLKNKIKLIMSVYSLPIWRSYLNLSEHEKLRGQFFKYPDLYNTAISEVIEFYPVLVDYIKSLEFKGNIKIKHSTNKRRSEKRHLHTLIKYSNKYLSFSNVFTQTAVCPLLYRGGIEPELASTVTELSKIDKKGQQCCSRKVGRIRYVDTSHNNKYRVENKGNRSYDITSIVVSSKCLPSYKFTLLRSNEAKISNKLDIRLSYLNSNYKISSSVFNELYLTIYKKLYSTDAGTKSGLDYLQSPEETTKNLVRQGEEDNLTHTQDPNIIQGQKVGAVPQQPIMSLRDIIEYKAGLVKISPYQGLLKNKENTKFKFGMNLLYPHPNEYSKFKDICDWKFRISQIINDVLKPGYTYDIAVIGRNILNEDYITYGKHFLINSESNIDAVITRIEGNILVNSASLNSGEYGVAETAEDLDLGFRLIVFSLRAVTFDLIVHNAANKVLLDNTRQKKNALQFVDEESAPLGIRNKNINNKELFDNATTPVRESVKAFFISIPNSNIINNYGILIKKHHTDISGIIGSLYLYKNKKILLHNTIIKNEVVLYTQGIVYKNDQEYFRYTDISIGDNTFLRTIGNTTIKYENNNIIYIDSKINSKKVERLKFELVRNKKYGSFDIETALDIDNNFIPVSCGWKINKKYKYYFIRDYGSAESMFKDCFKDMLEFNDYTWYAHNLGGFDAIFILQILLKIYPKTKVQFKDNKPLWIKVSRTSINNKSNKKETKHIVFKDSYKILPLSIRKLIKAFGITTNKLFFPYRFMRIDNLNYEGIIPPKSYYDNITDIEYLKLVDEFKDKNWNLKTELLKYMHNDIVALYKIIDHFSLTMFELENLNITSVSTLSSISLKTYLSNYYNNKITPIHIPRYVNYLDIKNAYFGGRVEVFKGYVENIYIYDVVSLYPFCMLKNLPIGCISKSTDRNLDNYFGFCYVSVNVPKGIRAPILPFRLDNGSLIYPTGNWSGWYPSEILKKARDSQNVSIEVHHGYKMEKSNLLFKKFVDKYTQMKITTEKNGNNALRTIIKLILNSLYGRFGLKYEPYSIDFVNSSKANEISINHEVFERLTIDNDIEYIKYTSLPSDILKEISRDEYNKLKNKTDLDASYVVRNLTIAAMITTYGSILMNPYLNNPDNPCYYTDTDSLFLKLPLEDKNVGTELGQFSFKGKAKRAYFISPKTYCLIMEDDKVIIKSKGLNNDLLNEEHFKELISGHNIEIDTRKIFTNIKKGSGGIRPMTLTIKPEIKNRKFINGEGLEFDSIPFHVIDSEVKYN